MESLFWKTYWKNKLAVIGLFLVVSLFIIAVFVPIIATHDPFALGPVDLEPPNAAHLMGTDNLGRDTFSGVIYGSRISLLVGFLAAGVSTFIGLLIGVVSGYYGGRVDNVLMRFTELFMVIPRLVFALVLVALFGSTVWNVIVVIGVLSWPRAARIVRGEFLSLREKEFVEAARATGASDFEIMFREILPNAITPVITNTTLEIAFAILLEASLSFLGAGDANVVSWGQMIHLASEFVRGAWWMAFFPGLAIFLTVLSFNLVGDGLNDALNPRLRRK